MLPILIMTIDDEDDRDFITRLFLQNERAMYSMAMKIVREYHAACDMVSQGCLKMIEKIDYLRKIDLKKRTPYILSIVKNESLMYLRKRRSEHVWLTDDERTLDSANASDDLETMFFLEVDIEILRKGIRRLKPRYRDLLEMKYFNEMNDEEISRQMGIAKDSVRQYLTIARRALKSEIRKEDDLNV